MVRKMQKTPEYVDNFRKIVKMVSIALNVTNHVAKEIWHRYAITHIDLTKIIEM
jgi:hypothetical protein